MAESPMLGARCPVEWQQEIKNIARASKKTDADIIREAIGEYLGKTSAGGIKKAIADLEKRVSEIERRMVE